MPLRRVLLALIMMCAACAHRRHPAGIDSFRSFVQGCLVKVSDLFSRAGGAPAKITEIIQSVPLEVQQLEAYATEGENRLGLIHQKGGQAAYLKFWRQQRTFSDGVRASLMTWVGEGRAQLYFERPSLLRRHKILSEFATWSHTGFWTSSWRTHNKSLGQVRLILGEQTPYMVLEWRMPLDQDINLLKERVLKIATDPLEFDVVPKVIIKRFDDDQQVGRERYQVLVVNILPMNERGFSIVDTLMNLSPHLEVHP